MANEIQVTGLGTGITDLFVYIIQATGADIGKVRDVVAGAWDAFVLADLGDYDVALTEAGVSGIYLGDMPALDAGRYIVVPFQGVPASQSITAYYDGALMVWNGTAEVFDIDTSGRVDVGKVAGTAQTANDNGADINAILEDTAEIANLNNVSITEINRECDTAISDAALATAASLAAVAGYIDTEIAAILEDTGTTIPAQITGLNNVSAAAVVTAIKAMTGITAGGNYTFAQLCKIISAMLAGKWQDKAGVSGTYQVLDPDNGTTVIMEITPAETTPQKTVSVLI